MLLLISIYMVSFLCSSVVSQQQQQQQPSAEAQSLCKRSCPPAWASSLGAHSSVLTSLLEIPGNALCKFVQQKKLMTACQTAGTPCGVAENVQFCCCAYSTTLKTLDACYQGPVTPNVCLPVDASPWMTGLIEAFQNTSFG